MRKSVRASQKPVCPRKERISSRRTAGRQDIEKRERSELAPYAAHSDSSRGRAYPEVEDSYRTAFQRDRDRIIHCTAFRRLEYKTQVFVNHEGDYYRTRLTHSIEVAQIARVIARALRLNEDLTETVALAHDIGHTPFGHSGEEALHSLMAAHGGFEHNKHGLRVVDILESRYPDFPGLNLTYEVRESIVKHTTSYDCPAPSEFEPDKRPLLEAQVVDVSDSIAYDNHDLDDGLKAGILNPSRLDEVPLWKETKREVRKRSGISDQKVLTAQVVRSLINREVRDIIENSSRLIERSGIRSPEDVRGSSTLVRFSDKMAKDKEVLENFLKEHLYAHYRVVRMVTKAKRFIEDLFSEYVRNPLQLPTEYRQWVKKEGLQRGVCDYIAGMTDRYAQQEHMKLFNPFERV
jgi:dGTPase